MLKILNFVKKIHYYSELFTSLLGDDALATSPSPRPPGPPPGAPPAPTPPAGEEGAPAADAPADAEMKTENE